MGVTSVTADSGRGTVPALPVLVFDGDCGFCTTSAHLAQRRLGLANVEPWQFLDLASIGLTAEECAESVQWVAVDGSSVAAERAVAAALLSAGGAWRLMGRLLLLPGIRHLAAVGYRLVARYRHRLPGGTPACRIR